MVQNKAVRQQKTISTANVVGTTWLTRYPRPMDNRNDQKFEFISHDFRRSLIEP